MKKNKKLDALFPAMERSKMSKISGGTPDPTSQLATFTQGGGADKGDPLQSGEVLDSI